MAGAAPIELSPHARRAALDLLAEGRRAGYVGPAAPGSHLEHALAFGDAVGGAPPQGATAMDLGAGGGLPGLILALAWPETTWCLVEASARRAGHLEAMVRRSSLGDRVLVLHERAELVAHEPEWREQAPLITARSFGPPAATAECAAGLVRIGGRLVVSEPPTPGDTPRWPSAPLRELGFTAEVAHARGFGFAVLTKRWPCPTSIPRRPGVPQRRLRF